MRTQVAKRIFKPVFQTAIQERSLALDEAAFPAYAHRNPLIDHLFWGRLEAAERFLATKPLKSVLDFGCGSGVMSYVMSGMAERVVATDLEPSTFNRIQTKVGFPENVTFVELPKILDETNNRSFDVVVALDVLEHVEDLTFILEKFERILIPKGVVLISGPTENVLYRFGRLIAGKRFTGAYHVSNIGRVESECRRYGRVQHLATLHPLLPLFKIFTLQFEP